MQQIDSGANIAGRKLFSIARSQFSIAASVSSKSTCAHWLFLHPKFSECFSILFACTYTWLDRTIGGTVRPGRSPFCQNIQTWTEIENSQLPVNRLFVHSGSKNHNEYLSRSRSKYEAGNTEFWSAWFGWMGSSLKDARCLFLPRIQNCVASINGSYLHFLSYVYRLSLFNEVGYNNVV
jgi:hypothetical protein